MYAFIAREPILDRNKNLFAYELLFRDGNEGTYPLHNAEKSKQITAGFHALGLDDISCDKTSFINFESKSLVDGLPTSLNPESVVVEINASPEEESGVFEACKHLKHLGFKLAVSNPNINDSHMPLFQLMDIVKINIAHVQPKQISRTINELIESNVRVVAEQVATYEDFNTYRELGVDLFQGYFFTQPENRIHRDLPASKMNLVELMGESSKSSFDLNRINNVIERDAALSFLVLKFINNPTINKRNKISSLKHALNYMGEVEIKKFIALLSLANLSDDKPIELIHMSLVRAKFFDLLSQRRNLSQNPPLGFLVGLFSLLESLLDQSMPDILQQLPVVDELKTALMGRNEEYASYLSLVKAFESAIWLTVIKQSRGLNIDQKELHSIYNQAITWGNGVRQSISAYFPSRLVD